METSAGGTNQVTYMLWGWQGGVAGEVNFVKFQDSVL